MDQIPADQAENLRKASTERLRAMAARIGTVDDDELANLDRMALIQVVAEDIVAKSDTERGATDRRGSQKTELSMEVDRQLELKKMEMEQKRLEIKMETRRMELEATRMEMEKEQRNRENEQRDKDRENEQRDKDRVFEIRRMELQNEREKRDHEFRMSEAGSVTGEIEGEGEPTGETAEGRPAQRRRGETLADRVKRYGSALKQVITPMSDDPTEAPYFFENLEAIFEAFEVPLDLRATLLLPFLSQRARILTARGGIGDFNDYAKLKDFILSEFKLTPREYKARFDGATKHDDETFVLFTARLSNNLRYYLRSREVDKKFDRLCDLLVADKLKTCMDNGPLNYILSLEGGNWFGAKQVAELADVFTANHAPTSQPRYEGNTPVTNKSPRRINRAQPYQQGQRGAPAQGKRDDQIRWQNQNIRCYNCNGFGHIAKFCHEFRQPTANVAQIDAMENIDRQPPESAQVSVCCVHVERCITPLESVVNCDQLAVDVPEKSINSFVACANESSHAQSNADWEFSQFSTVETNAVMHHNVSELKLTSLQIINVCMEGVYCKALKDSGAQIAVLSEALFDKIKPKVCGYINIHGVIGDALRAPLVNVNMKADEGSSLINMDGALQITCAVAPLINVSHDVILPSKIVSDLQCLSSVNLPSYVVRDVDDTTAVSNLTAANDCATEAVDGDGNDDDVSDGSINHVCDMAAVMTDSNDNGTRFDDSRDDDIEISGDYMLKDNKWFGSDKLVKEQRISRLCVPVAKCGQVLHVHMARDAVFNGHLGERKPSDNGSNFSSQSMRELLIRLGLLLCTICCWLLSATFFYFDPVFATAGRPQESRTDQRIVQGVILEPVETCITDLHHRFQQAVDWARLHAEYGQIAYAHHHIIQSRDKMCWEDDTVIIVLDMVATSKLCKWWHGPATVVRVKSAYSYLVAHAIVMCAVAFSFLESVSLWHFVDVPLVFRLSVCVWPDMSSTLI